MPLLLVALVAAFAPSIYHDHVQHPRREHDCATSGGRFEVLEDYSGIQTFDICRGSDGRILSVYERMAKDPGTDGNLARCQRMSGALYAAGHLWDKRATVVFLCVAKGDVAFWAPM